MRCRFTFGSGIGTADNSAALWPILSFGLWLDRLRGRDAGL